MKEMDLFQPEEENEEQTEAQAGVSGSEGLAGPESGQDPDAGQNPDQEDLGALEAMKALAGSAVNCLRSLMEDPDTSPTVRVKICEMILDRTYGKTSSTVKSASTAQTVQESLGYILSLVERVKEDAEAEEGDDPDE